MAEALYLAERVVALVPDDPCDWSPLARVYCLADDYKATLSNLDQARALQHSLRGEGWLLIAGL